jgi:ribonuclease D
MYIRTAAPLRRLCAQAQAEGQFALDLEFIREHSYVPRLALIQMAVSDTCAIIDPLEVHDLSPLLELCRSPQTLKVLHAAGQDTEILHWHAGIISENIFDTQIAAALVGLGDQLSYARLVDQLLGVTLSKGESYSNWLQRPLSPAQTAYALDDVRYLLSLHDALRQRLEAMGRTTWLAEECRKFANPELYQRDPQKLFRRIRRSNALSSQGLTILRELAIWRDREARQRDRPPGSVLHDALLRKAPRTLDDLQRLRGFPTREIERSGSALLECIAQGLAVPENARPQPLHGRGPTPAEELIVKVLEACLKALCAREKLSSAFIASRTDLETLVRRYRQGRLATEGSPILEGWRGDLVGQELLAVLSGRVSIQLHPQTGRVEFIPRAP